MLILGLCQLTEHTGERLEIMSEKKGTRHGEKKEGGRGRGGEEGARGRVTVGGGGRDEGETESNN